MKAKSVKRTSYEEQRNRLKEFLVNFEDFESTVVDERFGRKKYLLRLVSPLQFSKK